jgi:hypothetical protein
VIFFQFLFLMLWSLFYKHMYKIKANKVKLSKITRLIVSLLVYIKELTAQRQHGRVI